MLVSLVVATGCARPIVQAVSGAPQAHQRYGTVLAVRRAAGDANARGAILRAIGRAPSGMAMPADALAEFIVRADDGDTVSVMREDADLLRPGDRVAVTLGAPTRLARAPMAGG